MRKIEIIGFITLFLASCAFPNQNRPEEMRTLAESFRGSWVGSIENQEAGLDLKMWGKWTLGGHFLELEIVSRREEQIVDVEKFIFGWEALEKAYKCWYFNSKGESQTSIWQWKNGDSILQSSQPDNYFKLEENGSKLKIAINGKIIVFRLRNQ